MEEDIKILEEYIKDLKLTPEELLKSDEIIKFIEYKEIKAIQNLLARYKELEEENIHWKGKYYAVVNLIARYKELKQKYSNKLVSFQKEREEYEKDYIPKSKVKEKIEENNKIREKTEDNTIYTRMVDYIDCLQELLED